MTDITQAQLEEVVTYYVNANDKPTARNYIQTWGPRIPGYNIVAGLKQLSAAQPTTENSEEKSAAASEDENKPAETKTENKPIATETPEQTTTQPAGASTPPSNNVNENKEEK
jgi:hypothetical protein